MNKISLKKANTQNTCSVLLPERNKPVSLESFEQIYIINGKKIVSVTSDHFFKI